jgi:putative FmdB family regulatory protein
VSTYDFVCAACDGVFTIESDSPVESALVRCPDCGSERVRQTFESAFRNAVAVWSPRTLEERRCEHFG